MASKSSQMRARQRSDLNKDSESIRKMLKKVESQGDKEEEEIEESGLKREQDKA